MAKQDDQSNIGKESSDQQNFLRQTADELKKNAEPPPSLDLPDSPAIGNLEITAPAEVDGAKAKATPEIGAIESTGEHKGEIYGGIYPKKWGGRWPHTKCGGDNRPVWFSQLAPKLMTQYNAAAWAKEHGGSLPTNRQVLYLMSLKGKGGAFTELFNRVNRFDNYGSPSAGCVWLELYKDHFGSLGACQRLNDDRARPHSCYHGYELPALYVRR